ncbi:16S rRNA (adenine(1518)-N(6)/adenine(1519)-N(6))-dimethyltransferase RsmA [Candidatus Chlamydia sanziniae]|uniref:Ribosomal RNA small subunit methyltransferase A n=1 Tax=Candidatus Chlamydia sanziniae TaxID=1806891 RepID=A0A1A9HT98_9CHLA|nr:16S rRNA (adenine(1518)-N(6)/adenine(1519)-N(6))-dimethyltransferase RsmA [Candidatus Chlamydia sanziniae]ANH78220.1 SSU rRNA adenine dimethyltransferase [Candidatus Chlamydia sanziniae]
MSRSSREKLCRFLTEAQGKPKKGLSQNFLVDKNIVKKIVATSQLTPGDWVLEIGAGFGALTEELISQGARIVALEKDPLFLPVLEELPLVFEIIDARKYSLNDLKNKGWEGKGRVIANLPYHITTPLLTKLFLEAPHLWTTLTVMVQDEVARRITAQPGSKDYGSLTLFLQFFAEVRYAFKVSPSCFFPKPQVYSAVIHMVVKKIFPLPEMLLVPFFALTRTAFQQRRKLLTNTLKNLYSKDEVSRALHELGLPEKARPEILSLHDYLTLFQFLHSL